MDNSICDNHPNTSVVSILCQRQRHRQSLFSARRKGWASAEIPEVVCKKPRLCLSPTWSRMEICPSACGIYTHVKALRRMEETGKKASKQLALCPHDLWTTKGLYTVLKLGQFLYRTFQFCASILMSFPGKS